MAFRKKRNIPLRDYNYPSITTQSKEQPTINKKNSSNTGKEQSSIAQVITSLPNTSAKSAKMFVNFNKMFADGPPAEDDNSSDANCHSTPFRLYTAGINNDKGSCSDGLSTNTGYYDNLYCQPKRLPAGGAHHHAADKLILSASQCRLQPAGFKFFDPKTQVNVINLKLNDVPKKANGDGLMLSKRRNVVKNRTRATQTLFRESSAQTLPYLPGVSNDPAQLETLEIFKLPTILPGNGPPGLYEIEVLERARRRWNFAKALKENFRKQLQEAKEQAKLQEHAHILEAFEWEHWIEREENIQECQMMRFELLIRMFDERERDMHVASKIRIQKSYEEIEAKRKAALKKNEIEYNRAMRRLEIKHAQQPRAWRKEHIAHELGDPASEFYAPKMRHGVNPSRRHYIAPRKGFDMRMDDLEKKAIQMDPKNLKCPFAKLRKWSKPKEVLQEVEQNFCSDAKLNNLYDSLRTLRETTRKKKYTPLCLKTKQPATMDHPEDVLELSETNKREDIVTNQNSSYSAVSSGEHGEQSLEALEPAEWFEELRQQKHEERLSAEHLQQEMHDEELETLISSYQGNTIGWLMRFLSEEKDRLKEQRKLHFFTMMAKRNRWRRESAEAGLRQKENCMRETYEKLYEECSEINRDTTQKFLKAILSTDLKDYAQQKAEQDVTAVAKDIDKEITGWLESFGEVQSPLNYNTLRQALKDIVIPNEEKILERFERDICIDYIINDVLMSRIYQDLEPFDISFSLASDLVNRLIDNDLYLISPDYSSDCECFTHCSCSMAQKEARAVVRKVIRRAVPGRRWRTDEERVAEENLRDILDDALGKVITKNNIIEIDMKSQPNVSHQAAHTNLIRPKKDVIIEDHLKRPIPDGYPDKIQCNFMYPGSQTTIKDITKSIKWNEELLLIDPDKLPDDQFIVNKGEYVLPEPKPELSAVRIIPSYHDFSKIESYCKTPIFAQTSSEELLEKMQLAEEDTRDVMSSLSEDYGEQLDFNEHTQGSGEQGVEEDQELEVEVETERKEAEPIVNEDIPIPETIQFENFDKERSKEQTVQINDTPQEKVLSDGETEEEDNASGFMRFSFTYDPQFKFSVAMPSSEAHDNAGN